MRGKTQKQKADFKFWLVLVIIVCALICLRLFVIDWITISGDSMLPTLENGELVLVEKISNGNLNYGDIVILKEPSIKKELVKRVIACHGDELFIKDSVVYVNGKPLNEEYISDESYSNFNSIVIPKNSVFVMGDNRAHSGDSRTFGVVNNKDIIGKALFVIFPFEKIRNVN